MRKLFLFFLMILSVNIIFSEENDNKEEIRSVTDIWRDALLYGIDSEVLETIKSIRNAEETSLNNELTSVFAQSYNIEVRKEVISYFQFLKDNRIAGSAQVILRNYEDENSDIISAILYYLANIEAETDMDLLKELIEYSETKISIAAVTAISKCPFSDSEKLEISEYLIEKLDDNKIKDDVKPGIITAIGELGCLESVDKLMEIVENRYADKILRMYSADALGKIGDPRAVPVLKEVFSEQDALLKAYAASALSNFDAEGVVEILIQGLRDSNWRVRVTSAKGLGEMDAEEAVDILIYKVKNDPENVVRLEAITALGKIGTSAAFNFLREIYLDNGRSLDVRAHCLEMLIQYDLSNSIQTIKTLVQRDLTKTFSEQKMLESTANQIFKIESNELKEIFVLLLESSNTNVRITAVRGIANNRYTDLKDELETIAEEDSSAAIKEAAAAELDNW